MDLQLKGATYGADIWINGKLVAAKDLTTGTYRTPSFDVTSFLQAGKNVLVVLVGPSQPTSLAASWVDWNPTPQDKNMGLWQDVVLKTHGPVSVEHSFVETLLKNENTQAQLTVSADLKNNSTENVTGVLRGQIGELQFSQTVTVNAGQILNVRFVPSDFSQLIINNPKLWWPHQMGQAYLYNLKLNFDVNSQTSDQSELTFGIRQITSELTAGKARLFRVNGKPLQVRGGGWASDLFLRFSTERTKKELEYVKDLGLNTIRLEGRFEPDDFLKLTDQMGILVMTGWVCCNAWQDTAHWPAENYKIAGESMRDQIYQFRTHASVLTFLYGSDEAPAEKIEKIYLKALADLRWPNPAQASASNNESRLSGVTGFKMNGPYEYVPPSYWMLDQDKFGGAWGFNTESSPGPSIPPIESLKEFIPAEHLWPIDDVWNFHTGVNDFGNIVAFKRGLDLRYGESHSAEEFALKSQVMGYDNHRAMFEAFSKNRYKNATGVIQWMLNNSWPSLIWHLYDYYLRPGGTYYGVKKANALTHLLYSYNDRAVYLVNHSEKDPVDVVATIDMYNLKMENLFHKQINLEKFEPSSRLLTMLPAPKISEKTYFVKLNLKDRFGVSIDDNFYWLSTQNEIYDWNKTTYVTTPVLQEADLKELQNLAPAQVQVKAVKQNNNQVIELTNTGSALAFFVHLRLMQGAKEVLPVLWQDNYISLVPGEVRTVEVSYPSADLTSEPVKLVVDGWNLAPQTFRYLNL